MKKFTQQKTIHREAAMVAIQGAFDKAAELGMSASAAVMDRGGNLVAFAKDPDVSLFTIGICQDKATTSAGFGAPSSQFYDRIASNNSPGLTAGIVTVDRLATFGGGVPIYEGNELIGGIGVSGGSQEQDEECALAGLAKAGLASQPDA